MGSSFIVCRDCGFETLESTDIVVHIESIPCAFYVCYRCNPNRGNFCSDCGDFVLDGTGWCDSCAACDQAYEDVAI